MNDTKLKSEEGVTQRDPLSMAMYGIAILPLIKRLNMTETSQKWYADDGNSAGELTKLREVFRVLQEDGPNYGYFINDPKCQLITKKNMMEEAKSFSQHWSSDWTGCQGSGLCYRRCLGHEHVL